MSKRKPLGRRTLLRGAGGVAIGLPFLGAMLRPGRSVAQPGAIPRRVIFLFRGNGVVRDRWWPTGGERDFTLPSSLAPLADFRDQLIIPDGIDYTTVLERSGGRNGHDKGVGHALVCRPLQQGPSGYGEFGHLWDGSAGGISIDQHIANHFEGVTPYRSLEFGVRAEGIRQAVPSRISYRAAFEPVIPMNDAGQAFDRIFAPLAGDAAAQERRRRRRGLVLDAVQGQLGRLRREVGRDDQRRLDAHAAAIGDIQSRLGDSTGAICDAPPRATSGDYRELTRLHVDMMVKALECDLTRVASLQWSTGQGGVRFNFLGHDRSHHSLSHDGDSNADSQNKLAAIDRFYSEELAYLLGRLSMAREADGSSLLDHTVVVMVNEISKGNDHTFRRMPFLLAGSCGGAFRTGRRVQLDDVPHGNLYVSVMNAMGVPGESFGDPDFCTGPIGELA